MAVVDSIGSEASQEAKWLATEGLWKPTPEGERKPTKAKVITASVEATLVGPPRSAGLRKHWDAPERILPAKMQSL